MLNDQLVVFEQTPRNYVPECYLAESCDRHHTDRLSFAFLRRCHPRSKSLQWRSKDTEVAYRPVAQLSSNSERPIPHEVDGYPRGRTRCDKWDNVGAVSGRDTWYLFLSPVCSGRAETVSFFLGRGTLTLDKRCGRKRWHGARMPRPHSYPYRHRMSIWD